MPRLIRRHLTYSGVFDVVESILAACSMAQFSFEVVLW